MKHVNLRSLRISAPQLVYKAFKNGESRSRLIPTFAEMSFNVQDYGILMDPNFFSGIDQKIVKDHLETLFNDGFSSQGIKRLFLQVFSYWMSQGIVPLDLAQKIVQSVSKSNKERSISVNLLTSLIRAVFNRVEYKSLRQMTVCLLFVETDHIYIFPRPFSMGILGGVREFFNEPEFISAIESGSVNSLDIHALVETETARINRVTREALDLSDGIQNVIQTYTVALAKLGSFEITLDRKIVLLNSIFRSLKLLNSADGESHRLSLDHIDHLIDNFVRTAINLVVQIHSDRTAPRFMLNLDAESIETYMEAIIGYVRESDVQVLLVFHLFSVIKERPESHATILEIIPRFINWRRFLLISDTFNFIFNFSNPKLFDKFMFDIINGAFRFEDFNENDAIDLSRGEKQILMVHEFFFATMATLISEYNLPVKYIILALDKMILNFSQIEIISNSLVRFLHAAIRNRQIDQSSPVFRITSKSYGHLHGNGIQYSQNDIVKRVIEFLGKRPDFLTLAIVNSPDSESFEFMKALENIAKDSLQLAPIKLIHSIFSFPSVSGIENLKLIRASVPLPVHTIRELAEHLLFVFSKNSALETVHNALIVLNLFPQTFIMISFLDSSFSHSWYNISKGLINLIAKLCTTFRQQFAISIDESGVAKFLNILQWHLEYDEKEELVSSALNAFLASLCDSEEKVKSQFVRLLTDEYFRPLTGQILKLKLFYSSTCSHFRRWTCRNSSLAMEVEKLISSFISDKPVTADEIDATFHLQLTGLQDIIKTNQISGRDFLVAIASISDYFFKFRSTREIDLTLKFISMLVELARSIYPQIPTEDTIRLARLMELSIIALRTELLLQSNGDIFVDFFKCLFKHSRSSNSPQYFEVIQIILSQIHSSKNIQNVLLTIISDMRLESCLLPSAGFPDQFYEDSTLFSTYLDSYFEKMNHLGTSNSLLQRVEVGIDGLHFIHIFNCGHNSNASDSFFLEWIENVLRVRESFVFTKIFTKNLKEHCLKRKHLVPLLIHICLNPSFIEQMLISCCEQSKENLFAVFKLMMMNDPKFYEAQVKKLPENLQSLMNESIGSPLNEKRREIVRKLVETRNLPNEIGFKFADVAHLKIKLETLAKLDLSLLSSEQVSIFFRRLDILIDELVNQEIGSDYIESLKIISVALMIQSKYGNSVNSSGLLLFLKGHVVVLDLAAEANLTLLKATSVALKFYNFTDSDAISIALLAIKSFKPESVILDLLNNTNLNCHVTRFMKTILESKHKLEIELLMQNIIFGLIKNNREDPNLADLCKLAISYKLLPKSLILLTQMILK